MEETISEDELAYHLTVIAQSKAAQAAMQAWAGHLSAKYNLAPGDGINEAGIVVRAPVEEPPKP